MFPCCMSVIGWRLALWRRRQEVGLEQAARVIRDRCAPWFLALGQRRFGDRGGRLCLACRRFPLAGCLLGIALLTWLLLIVLIALIVC